MYARPIHERRSQLKGKVKVGNVYCRQLRMSLQSNTAIVTKNIKQIYNKGGEWI